MEKVLNRFEIVDLSEVTFVSDRGANFLKALKRFQAYSYVAYRLNNIVKRCFFVNEENKNKEDSMDSVVGYEDNEVEEDRNFNRYNCIERCSKKSFIYSSKCNRIQETHQICEASKLSSIWTDTILVTTWV